MTVSSRVRLIGKPCSMGYGRSSTLIRLGLWSIRCVRRSRERRETSNSSFA